MNLWGHFENGQFSIGMACKNKSVTGNPQPFANCGRKRPQKYGSTDKGRPKQSQVFLISSRCQHSASHSVLCAVSKFFGKTFEVAFASGLVILPFACKILEAAFVSAFMLLRFSPATTVAVSQPFAATVGRLLKKRLSSTLLFKLAPPINNHFI